MLSDLATFKLFGEALALGLLVGVGRYRGAAIFDSFAPELLKRALD